MEQNKLVVCFGEVLWDMLPEGARLGGAPLNVCYHLKAQGIASKIVSQVGNDANGTNLLNEMKQLAIDTSFCSSTDRYPTSTVEVKLLDKGKIEYTIVENVAWDYISYSEEIANTIANADAFVFGSLALRNIHSRTTLLAYLEKAKYVIMDVNMRAPFIDEKTVLQLMGKCDTLKINDDELLQLALWLNVKAIDETEMLKQVFNKFPKLTEILLTMGARGAMYYSAEITLNIPARKITVKDTIGSGDSFLAAFLATKLKGNTIKSCLENAVDLSAFIATKSGACPSYSQKDLYFFKENS